MKHNNELIESIIYKNIEGGGLNHTYEDVRPLFEFMMQQYAEKLIEQILPSDEQIQKIADDFASEHFDKSDNHNSDWWLEAETFTNGARFIINKLKSKI